MDGRNVDVVIYGYLLITFILNGLLCSLGYDFWTISMIELTISPDYLARDSSVMIGFFGKRRLFTWIDFMNR